MTRPRPVPPALALAALLALTACGGNAPAAAPAAAVPTAGPSESLTAVPTPVPTPVPTAASTSAPSARTSAAPAAPAAPAADAPTVPAATRGPAPVPSAARPGAPAVAEQPAAARSAAPASRATRAGRYTYDSRGTFTAGAAPRTVSGSAVLRIDPPVRDTQSAVLESDQGRTETDTLLRPDGRYVARLLLTTPAFSKEFAPSPAALLLPEPAAVGRTWSWKATSTDGKTTVTTANRVVRESSLVVGGDRVETVVVETRLTLRGDVTYDGTTTTDYAPARRLAVRDRGQGRGTVNGVPFSADTTSTLRSLDPAQ